MTMQEFIGAIARRTDYSRGTVKDVIDTMYDVAVEKANEGEEVPLIKGTKLYKKTIKARKYHNPLTGGIIDKPERTAFKIKVLKSLQDALVEE